MKALLDRARSFKRRVDFESDEYRKLAVGQFPEALFITCSDSRVIPALITGARPGEIFELRNAGNIVPPHEAYGAASGEAATIEYALEVLGVQDIVVCGHSHCGAMGALKYGADLSGLPRVDAWLDYARPALEPVLGAATGGNGIGGNGGGRDGSGSDTSGGDGSGRGSASSEDPALREVVQLNIRNQLAVLREYPVARQQLDAERLRLHGWYYEIDTGQVHELDADGDFQVHGS
ncbi:carbonic anhydrase [Streptomyces sp. ID01-12c]|uniref:Carbonic anhydrase n=1 Tax=Streptomyces caniscabiei TaxID=2746961 RepID=A0A927QE84_9ACTN|nr:carbonic anhydrase [Streptomyces caniscabiei]MBD9701400.1 carbonic anhydrase [Streptomyces caniscabiei]MBD9723598.1 carbonic anhydrase [Streptomyces caniscabiei]MDX3511082.1 carbonic anhydrase [Streptomyces caniscabiei]MDX3721162.1 carbonic anhydrase [Streptomyces caniscabiei]MDX3725564.1 carbonic anhydrase [Streptomyces caniscabiei]